MSNQVKSLLGNGVVIDPRVLLEDLKLMRKNSIRINGSMIISDRCSLVTALHHKIEERLRQVRKEAFEDDELWLHG